MSVNEKMTDIADAIRSKTGKSGTLTLAQMAAAISGIEVADRKLPGVYIGAKHMSSVSSAITITHNLNTENILLACIWPMSAYSTPTFDSVIAQIWSKMGPVDGEPSTGITFDVEWSKSENKAVYSTPDELSVSTGVVDANNFKFGTSLLKKFTNCTYRIMIIASNAPGFDIIQM